MALNRSLMRWIARLLAGVLLVAQLAVAAHACPGRAAAGGAVHAGVPVASGDEVRRTADPASAPVCAEHCSPDRQSDQAGSAAASASAPVALYDNRLPPLAEPKRRPAASRLDALLASTPPHAILHCVRRT